MFHKVFCAALDAIDAVLVQAEADVSDGLPVFDMVGLLSSEVREAKERVRVAMKNSGFLLPPKRVTVNLSPADIRKDGTSFDLPIAVAVLVASGYLQAQNTEKILFVGELSLDGTVNSVNGVLPMVFEAKNQNFPYCMVPYENYEEAIAVKDISILAVKNLHDVISAVTNPDAFVENFKQSFFLSEEADFSKEDSVLSSTLSMENDFSSLVGQPIARRAAEVAAAGHHNILFCGPPGAGKTMIAKRIPSILPELTEEESIQITKIYSVAGKLPLKGKLLKTRPFRAPHHTATVQALVGGGRRARPGEISLASEGVLFLDELPEFPRAVIEVLRQPLEEKQMVVDRVTSHAVYPANFMLVAAMNPCKCGFYPDRTRCHCTDTQLQQYKSKLSQPILDRIDIHIEIHAVPIADWFQTDKQEDSYHIRERVVKARHLQQLRYQNESFSTNSQIPSSRMDEFCPLEKEEKELMMQAFSSLQLSGRGYHRILKVARTIADLEGSDKIEKSHLCEALSYRL